MIEIQGVVIVPNKVSYIQKDYEEANGKFKLNIHMDNRDAFEFQFTSASEADGVIQRFVNLIVQAQMRRIIDQPPQPNQATLYVPG